MGNSFDLDGARLKELMEGRNFTWEAPPAPFWRMEPSTLLGSIFSRAKKSYEQRLAHVVASVLEAFPGSLLTCSVDMSAAGPGWTPADLKRPSWKTSQTGALVRENDLDNAPAWNIPEGVDALELLGHLRAGGWAIWKPTAASKDLGIVPRLLAQDSLQTVLDCQYEFLMTSWWDNQFTELAMNETLVGEESTAAA